MIIINTLLYIIKTVYAHRSIKYFPHACVRAQYLPSILPILKIIGINLFYLHNMLLSMICDYHPTIKDIALYVIPGLWWIRDVLKFCLIVDLIEQLRMKASGIRMFRNCTRFDLKCYST